MGTCGRRAAVPPEAGTTTLTSPTARSPTTRRQLLCSGRGGESTYGSEIAGTARYWRTTHVARRAGLTRTSWAVHVGKRGRDLGGRRDSRMTRGPSSDDRRAAG